MTLNSCRILLLRTGRANGARIFAVRVRWRADDVLLLLLRGVVGRLPRNMEAKMLENGIWLGHVISDEHGDAPTGLLWQARSGSNHGKNDATISRLENDVSILSGVRSCHPLLHLRRRIHDNLSVFVRGIFYRAIRLRFVHHIRPVHNPVCLRCHPHHFLRPVFHISDHQGEPSHPIAVRAVSSQQINRPRVRQQLLQPFLSGFRQAGHENASKPAHDADDYITGEMRVHCMEIAG